MKAHIEQRYFLLLVDIFSNKRTEPYDFVYGINLCFQSTKPFSYGYLLNPRKKPPDNLSQDNCSIYL